jgi:MFS family permease
VFISLLNLLLAVLLLELSSGLLGVLVPVRADLAGFPTETIGGLGTVYYLGFVAGCIVLPRTVRRFGHIRCFSALAAIAASVALLHAIFVTLTVWLILRLIIGFCFAGLFMVLESWLNAQAIPQNRGRVLGMYMAATWIGVIGGKMLFSVAPPDVFHLFAVASMAVGLSLVPIALTIGAIPEIPRPARLGIADLYKTAPIGLIGCVAIGITNGSFWTFAPLFAQARTDSSFGISLFMTACVGGGALAQWPIGRFSDRVDRRLVIVGACLASIASGLLLAVEKSTADVMVLMLAFLFGASALPLYSLCVAHGNDRADPSTLVDVSSHLLFAFGLGAIVGPFLAGLLISETGIASLFVFTATIHMAFAVFAVTRIKLAKPVLEEERVVFTAQPPIGQGTQAVIELNQEPPKEKDEDDDPNQTRPRSELQSSAEASDQLSDQ